MGIHFTVLQGKPLHSTEQFYLNIFAPQRLSAEKHWVDEWINYFSYEFCYTIWSVLCGKRDMP